jgi:hypothetical protein
VRGCRNTLRQRECRRGPGVSGFQAGLARESLLVINPGLLLDKGGQGLELFLGEINFTLLFLDLGQVPLEIQKRFPKIVEHGLQGIQGQDEGLLMLAFGQQFPSPLQLVIGMIDIGLAIHGKTSRGGLARKGSKYHTRAAEFVLSNNII